MGANLVGGRDFVDRDALGDVNLLQAEVGECGAAGEPALARAVDQEADPASLALAPRPWAGQ